MPNVTVGTDTCRAESTLERIPPRSSEFNTENNNGAPPASVRPLRARALLSRAQTPPAGIGRFSTPTLAASFAASRL
jgi:hypothetical protein